MFAQSILSVVLVLAALLCTLVAGFVLLFAIVVMPGIGTLPDREFLRVFRSIDKVIQSSQPMFVLIWIGSIAASLVATALGIYHLDSIPRVLVIAATAANLVGVQLPTFCINIPLNNRLHTLNLDAIDEALQATERRSFETTWNRWNVFRTIFAFLSSVALLIALRLNDIQ